MTVITVTPFDPPTKEDIERKRQKALWKKEDLHHARKSLKQTEIQMCNALFWRSTFVHEVQPTPIEKAHHAAMIEDEYLEYMMHNAPRKSQKATLQFEEWQFQEKQAYSLQQQQQNYTSESFSHFIEEELQMQILQFQNHDTALSGFALENQFQWI